MSYMIGVDIGGTFTDEVVADDDGEIQIFKSPTTPSNPSDGLFSAVHLAADEYGLAPQELLGETEKFTYGTTITTNILVEKTGADVGLLTTKGFGDVLPISQIGRDHLEGDVKLDRPESLVPRSRIKEIPERVKSDGSILLPIDEKAVQNRVDELIEAGCDALAVAFLWSHENSQHEQLVAEYARDEYNVDVTLSSEIAPLQGEYERTATAVLNAFLRPDFRDHLTSLNNDLSELGYSYPLMVMQSTGGLLTSDECAQRPVSTLFSGPAGAITASQIIGTQVDNKDIINIDMGGTSFDVSVITDGDYETNQTARAGGHNILAPQIDIHSIGAGGGSIAWIDKNRLRVGPKSAGATPGPICYDRGGTKPTVTDADLLLGYINPDYFVGGQIDLDAKKAEEGIREKIAEPLGLSTIEAAAGIRRIVDAEMSDAIRVLTVEKGYDPRNYTIIACGGAGPMHAMSLAEELGIGEVVIPYTASVHSALGILSSNLQRRLSKTMLTDLTDTTKINEGFDELIERTTSVLLDQGATEANIEYEYAADMRFRGQSHELELFIPEIPLDADAASDLRNRFEERYESVYGHGSIYEDATVELVRLTIEATVETATPSIAPEKMAETIPEEARKESREAYFLTEEAFLETEIFDGESLQPGNQITGPAVIERTGTTIVVNPSQTATVDEYQNVNVTMEGEQ